MMEKTADLNLTWKEIDQLVELLARQLRHTTFDVVLGVARSGLVPAVILSHVLGVRDFAACDIKRTRSDEVDAPKLTPVLRGILNEGLLKDRNVLLVDDIVGAGLTMKMACNLLGPLCKSLTTCALVVNRANLRGVDPRDIVHHHACVVHGWITFPWEIAASLNSNSSEGRQCGPQ
jgi:uncharacterized protein